jgi:hypothetical protein
MGIFDRIGDVIKSYLNYEDERVFGSHSERTRNSSGTHNSGGGIRGDPDVDAAFDELNEFLNRGKTGASFGDDWGAAGPGRSAGERDRAEGRDGNAGTWGAAGPGRSAGSRGRAGSSRSAQAAGPGRTVPESLRPDFTELGLPFGASADDCKAAYKKLLKLHHPDRHASHAGNMKKATEKTARINAAFDRIERWRQTGRSG